MTAPLPSTAPGAPADGGTGGQAPTGTQPPAAPPAPTGQQPGSGTQPQPTDLSTLPADVRKLIEDTRAEAAKHRTDKQTATQQAQAAQAQRDKVLAALGFTPDGQQAAPDANALAAQLEQQQAVAWTNAVELNVFRTAQAAGANGEALLDSRAFIDSLDGFTEDDVTASDFRTKLKAHIKAYVEKHPTFKTATTTTTAPPRAGGDRPAGGSGTQPPRPLGLGAAIKQHYGQRGS
jgi:hypothetical protein